MRRAERVVHIDVAQGRQFPRELGVVLLFLGVEAQVFEQQHFAGRGLHGFHFRPDAIGRHLHRAAEQFAQARRHRLQTHFRIRLAFGPPEVGRQDDAGAVFERVLNGGQRRLDALVAGDFHVAPLILLERHIEIHADEDPLPVQIEIANG